VELGQTWPRSGVAARNGTIIKTKKKA